MLKRRDQMATEQYEKVLREAKLHLEEADNILNMGAEGEIGEECARLCADTQVMFALHAVEDLRRQLRKGYDW